MLLLFVSAAALTTLGLTMILSAGSVSAVEGYGTSFWYFNRQVIGAVAGAIALVAFWRIPYGIWRKLALPMVLLLVPLMLLTLHSTAGSSLYGAARWIQVGPITVQPSELMKFAMVALAAAIVVKKWDKLDEPMHIIVPLVLPVMLVVSGLVLLQRDLGTTVILCAAVFGVLFAAGVRLRYLVIGGSAGTMAAFLLIFGEAYRRTRFVDAFLDPWSDPKGAGFQLIQGLIALGSGGWTGVGLAASRQKWDYVSNAHSDFIFAIIGEELGFLGTLAVIVVFGVFLLAGIRIAVAAPDRYGKLLAAGITSWIGVQTLVNLGGVTGLLPITGVPLPFLSFGNTALVITLAAVGVLASIARQSARRAGESAETP